MNLRITYCTFMVVLWDIGLLVMIPFAWGDIPASQLDMSGFPAFVIVSNVLVWLFAFAITCQKTKEEHMAEIEKKWRDQGLI
jgi:hypothetical protein